MGVLFLTFYNLKKIIFINDKINVLARLEKLCSGIAFITQIHNFYVLEQLSICLTCTMHISFVERIFVLSIFKYSRLVLSLSEFILNLFISRIPKELWLQNLGKRFLKICISMWRTLWKNNWNCVYCLVLRWWVCWGWGRIPRRRPWWIRSTLCWAQPASTSRSATRAP